jgi:hypothetical protein
LAHQTQDLVLVADVQVRRRLVENEQTRRLRQCPGDDRSRRVTRDEADLLASGRLIPGSLAACYSTS